MAEAERKLPFALEAEQSVLGSILIDPEKFNDVTNIITADDFYLSEHAEIFSAMRDLFMENREIDLVTLIDMLVKRGVYNEEESKKYIKIIAQIVPSAENVRDYANIVKSKSVLRALIKAAEEIRDDAYSEQGDITYLVDNAEKKIFDISNGNESKTFVTIGEAIQQTYERLDLINKNKKAAMGTPTGYDGLDKTIVGLGPGDLLILGARNGKNELCHEHRRKHSEKRKQNRVRILSRNVRRTARNAYAFCRSLRKQLCSAFRQPPKRRLDKACGSGGKTFKMQHTHRRYERHYRNGYEIETAPRKEPWSHRHRLFAAYDKRKEDRQPRCRGQRNIARIKADGKRFRRSVHMLRTAIPRNGKRKTSPRALRPS